MHVLLALSKSDVREMVIFALETRYPKMEISEVSSAKSAIKFLAENKVGLIISEHLGIGDILFKHLASMDRAKTKTPVIICALGKPKKDQVTSKLTVQGYASLVNLVDDLYKILDDMTPPRSKKSKRVPSDLNPADDPEYCRIKTILLTRVGPLQAGVYIQLSKTHYVKLFREGDVFDQKDYARYMGKKKLEYFHLKTSETSEFVSKIKLELLEILSSSLMSQESVSEISQAVHETVQQLILQVGVTKEIQELVKTNIQLSMKAIGRSPKLSHVLKELNKDPKQYIASHSIFLAELACALSKSMDWHSETTFHKLNLAAFLHDMPLKNQTLAAIENMEELMARKSSFTPEEIKAYQLHTVNSAELARQFSELPPEVDAIIAQHHELPDGSGFPRGLTASHISPLASLFIVAHDVIWNAMHTTGKGGDKFDMKAFLENTQEKYSIGHFRKVHKCLSEIKI